MKASKSDDVIGDDGSLSAGAVGQPLGSAHEVATPPSEVETKVRRERLYEEKHEGIRH